MTYDMWHVTCKMWHERPGIIDNYKITLLSLYTPLWVSYLGLKTDRRYFIVLFSYGLADTQGGDWMWYLTIWSNWLQARMSNTFIYRLYVYLQMNCPSYFIITLLTMISNKYLLVLTLCVYEMNRDCYYKMTLITST